MSRPTGKSAPRDPAILERRIRSLSRLAAQWRKRAVAAEEALSAARESKASAAPAGGFVPSERFVPVSMWQNERLSRITAERERDDARAQLAAAKREGFVAGADWCSRLADPEHALADEAYREADARYPAPSPAAAPKHCGCWADRAPGEPCVCRPAAAPTREPEREVRVYVERQQLYPQIESRATGDWVRFTPADAAALVALAAQHGGTDGR